MGSFLQFSYLKFDSTAYLEQLWQDYQEDPGRVEPTWRYFFDGILFGQQSQESQKGRENTQSKGVLSESVSLSQLKKEVQVAQLIYAYRQFGHLRAQVNPLQTTKAEHPYLTLAHVGLSPDDLTSVFQAAFLLGRPAMSLKSLLDLLQGVYCKTIGVDLGDLASVESLWLMEQFEALMLATPLVDHRLQRELLQLLVKTEAWEKFLHTRYVAQKRFSLEGVDCTIVLLNALIQNVAETGAKEVVIGMAHRGRLNVLRNLLEKPDIDILIEFEGNYDLTHSTQMIEGDVKYHMGYSADFVTASGQKCHLSLGFNPSHLEFINPIIQGMTYAKQSKYNSPTQVLPIAIHGDASFAGQGVCYETLTLSRLEGYSTWGTIHVVINNQIGFTTDPIATRSSEYSTDVMKMLGAPVLHVNADDPDAVYLVAKLAAQYREKFGKDICIDLIGYRRHGHNESDEPLFTQPVLYQQIKDHPTVATQYGKKCIENGIVSADELATWHASQMSALTQAQKATKEAIRPLSFPTLQGLWKGFHRPRSLELFDAIQTQVTDGQVLMWADQIFSTPASFEPNPKIARLLGQRLSAVKDDTGFDWGVAEMLAYASLVSEGVHVRLSGQDVQRGTFSHRHCLLHDARNNAIYSPIASLKATGVFQAINSPLSETAVLGFEFGVASADPSWVVIWEAQFGDFANGAQVIIDQFIATSESKWQRMNGIILLLPHGYEGQGPEHSSARIERFLQLSGLYNWSVCNLSTPAQVFHAFRRQSLRTFRKPLVIFSPKSLLRNPLAVSFRRELTGGGFEEILDDPVFVQKERTSVKRILLCSGKVYYECSTFRQKQNIVDTAIIRIEQLYPWASAKIAQVLNLYPKSAQFFWVQEEPRNMGAWSYIFNVWNGGLDEFCSLVQHRKIGFVGRPTAAAPAVGSHKLHEAQQSELIKSAFVANL